MPFVVAFSRSRSNFLTRQPRPFLDLAAHSVRRDGHVRVGRRRELAAQHQRRRRRRGPAANAATARYTHRRPARADTTQARRGARPQEEDGRDAEAPAPSTAPGAGFACAATTETASPLAARVPRAPSPPSPVRSLHDDAFDPPPQPAPPPAAAAPENLERKRAFAAALAAAMAQTPGDGDGDDPIPAGGATRPDWLVSPTDAAGAPRPVTAYSNPPSPPRVSTPSTPPPSASHPIN